MKIISLGDSALILQTRDSLGEVLTLARRLEAAKISGAQEIVPAFASVGIFFEEPCDLEAAAAEIRAALKRRLPLRKKPGRQRPIEIPVCYEPEFAVDLEEIAIHCRLSPNEVVRRHAAGHYKVRCVGFTPGFPYLAGLPPSLAMPRRATPRTSVPAGSVAIGGVQTGIYPLPSPGGWNIIGRTPLRLFDPAREPAAFLRPGDAVRIRAISGDEFDRWDD